jgi:hypothetical protein
MDRGPSKYATSLAITFIATKVIHGRRKLICHTKYSMGMASLDQERPYGWFHVTGYNAKHRNPYPVPIEHRAGAYVDAASVEKIN